MSKPRKSRPKKLRISKERVADYGDGVDDQGRPRLPAGLRYDELYFPVREKTGHPLIPDGISEASDFGIEDWLPGNWEGRYAPASPDPVDLLRWVRVQIDRMKTIRRFEGKVPGSNGEEWKGQKSSLHTPLMRDAFALADYLSRSKNWRGVPKKPNGLIFTSGDALLKLEGIAAWIESCSTPQPAAGQTPLPVAAQSAATASTATTNAQAVAVGSSGEGDWITATEASELAERFGIKYSVDRILKDSKKPLQPYPNKSKGRKRMVSRKDFLDHLTRLPSTRCSEQDDDPDEIAQRKAEIDKERGRHA